METMALGVQKPTNHISYLEFITNVRTNAQQFILNWSGLGFQDGNKVANIISDFFYIPILKDIVSH